MAKKILMQNKETGARRWMFTADAKECMSGKDGKPWVPAATITGESIQRPAPNAAQEQADRESAMARGTAPDDAPMPLEVVATPSSMAPMVDDAARGAEFPDDE